MSAVEFFFDYGSPYSYLASTRVEEVASASGAKLIWRPFLLGAVFKATGVEPPVANMFKASYLFKDLQDWARHYGLPEVALPLAFPIDSLKANRLGLVAQELGRVAQWTRAVFAACFVEGKDVGDPQVLTSLLRGLDLDPQACFARMLSAEIKERLRQNTSEAVDRGAFGAPTFFVGERMFFGNDRLGFVASALEADRWVDVAALAELPPGAKASFAVGEDQVAVVNVEGRLFGVDNNCPHRGGPLAQGELCGHALHCPLHAWPFDVRTGRCSLYPEARLRVFEVQVRQGRILVAAGGRLT